MYQYHYFATGTSQCNISSVGIRITEGAVWVNSLTNPNSVEFHTLGTNLTVAVSYNNIFFITLIVLKTTYRE